MREDPARSTTPGPYCPRDTAAGPMDGPPNNDHHAHPRPPSPKSPETTVLWKPARNCQGTRPHPRALLPRRCKSSSPARPKPVPRLPRAPLRQCLRTPHSPELALGTRRNPAPAMVGHAGLRTSTRTPRQCPRTSHSSELAPGPQGLHLPSRHHGPPRREHPSSTTDTSGHTPGWTRMGPRLPGWPSYKSFPRKTCAV